MGMGRKERFRKGYGRLCKVVIRSRFLYAKIFDVLGIRN